MYILVLPILTLPRTACIITDYVLYVILFAKESILYSHLHSLVIFLYVTEPMAGGDSLETVLLVSNSEKNTAFFTKMLCDISCHKIIDAPTCTRARDLLTEQTFDLCIINAPLCDEDGESLATHISSTYTSQVILIVQKSHYETIRAKVEEHAVITVAKPLSSTLFLSALHFAKATENKLRLMQTRNTQLTKKIQDIRIIDRAKCILISHLNMSEPEAHSYIEKQAMDTRTTKRIVAEGILKTYEN
jgi:Response regulator with putative antiterminator output domain